jgi:cation diffusion facilitator family transporter
MEGMTTHDLSGLQHEHVFDEGNLAGERRTWAVVVLTAATMVAEIVGGMITGSMALLADGWHMATHVVALSIAGAAYLLARRWSADSRFAFGTWKIEVLGAFSSALLLGVVALAMIVESVHRLVAPAPIQFGWALAVAGIGLAVNLAMIMTTITIAALGTTATTSTCARPTCTCSPTRSPRCSPSRRSPRDCGRDGPGSIP